MFNLIPWWLKLAIIAGCFAVGGATGWWFTADHYQGVIAKKDLAQAQALLAAEKKGRDAQAAADKITHDQDVANAKRQQQIQIVYRNIIQKVPFYVTPETDRAFPLPCGFIRLHDAAANGVDPATLSLPAGKSDADRCEVAASSAATIIAGNYTLALGWQSDLKAWDGWYKDQKANYDAYLASLKKEN